MANFDLGHPVCKKEYVIENICNFKFSENHLKYNTCPILVRWDYPLLTIDDFSPVTAIAAIVAIELKEPESLARTKCLFDDASSEDRSRSLSSPQRILDPILEKKILPLLFLLTVCLEWEKNEKYSSLFLWLLPWENVNRKFSICLLLDGM